MRPYVQSNEALVATLEQAEHIGYLGVDGLDAALRPSLIAAMKEMCVGIISGARPSTVNESLPGDRVAQDCYHEGIKELLSMAIAAGRDLA